MAHWRWGDLCPSSLSNSAYLESPAKVCGSERCGGLRAAFQSLTSPGSTTYDVWFPNLSPSSELVKEALGAAGERAWAAFRRKFRREMRAPGRSRELDVLAALSHHTNLSLGCYC
jgi:carbonic anhydrase